MRRLRRASLSPAWDAVASPSTRQPRRQRAASLAVPGLGRGGLAIGARRASLSPGLGRGGRAGAAHARQRRCPQLVTQRTCQGARWAARCPWPETRRPRQRWRSPQMTGLSSVSPRHCGTVRPRRQRKADCPLRARSGRATGSRRPSCVIWGRFAEPCARHDRTTCSRRPSSTLRGQATEPRARDDRAARSWRPSSPSPLSASLTRKSEAAQRQPGAEVAGQLSAVITAKVVATEQLQGTISEPVKSLNAGAQVARKRGHVGAHQVPLAGARGGHAAPVTRQRPHRQRRGSRQPLGPSSPSSQEAHAEVSGGTLLTGTAQSPHEALPAERPRDIVEDS